MNVCMQEGAFEVAVFAELFREMLEARFGRGLSRCLAAIGAMEREVLFSPPLHISLRK